MSVVSAYPLSVTVGSLRTMGRSPQRSPVVVKISCRIHLMLSKQTTLSASHYYSSCASQSAIDWRKLTSRMKNLAVLALPQVFFSRDTGLMFIPAARGN